MLLGLESQPRLMVRADENENTPMSSSCSTGSSVQIHNIFCHANDHDTSSTTVSFMEEHLQSLKKDNILQLTQQNSVEDQQSSLHESVGPLVSSPAVQVPSKLESQNPHAQSSAVSPAMKVVHCIMVFLMAIHLLMRNLTNWWRRYRRSRQTRDQLDLENAR